MTHDAPHDLRHRQSRGVQPDRIARRLERAHGPVTIQRIAALDLPQDLRPAQCLPLLPQLNMPSAGALPRRR